MLKKVQKAFFPLAVHEKTLKIPFLVLFLLYLLSNCVTEGQEAPQVKSGVQEALKGPESLQDALQKDVKALEEGMEEIRKNTLKTQKPATASSQSLGIHPAVLKINPEDTTTIKGYLEYQYTDCVKESLETPPLGLEFPNFLRDKVDYDKKEKSLTFTGVMSEKEKETLEGLSPKDVTYKNAIEALFTKSKALTLKIRLPKSFTVSGEKSAKEIRVDVVVDDVVVDIVNYADLKELPTGLSSIDELRNKVNDALKQKIDYKTGYLTFKDIMTESERDELLKLSSGPLYTSAVKELFKKSQKLVLELVPGERKYLSFRIDKAEAGKVNNEKFKGTLVLTDATNAHKKWEARVTLQSRYYKEFWELCALFGFVVAGAGMSLLLGRCLPAMRERGSNFRDIRGLFRRLDSIKTEFYGTELRSRFGGILYEARQWNDFKFYGGSAQEKDGRVKNSIAEINNRLKILEDVQQMYTMIEKTDFVPISLEKETKDYLEWAIYHLWMGKVEDAKKAWESALTTFSPTSVEGHANKLLKKLEERFPDVSEALASPPEGFPPRSLVDKISYDAGKKLLIFKGLMGEEEKEKLLNLPSGAKKKGLNDTKYHEAIERLYEASRRNLILKELSELDDWQKYKRKVAISLNKLRFLKTLPTDKEMVRNFDILILKLELIDEFETLCQKFNSNDNERKDWPKEFLRLLQEGKLPEAVDFLKGIREGGVTIDKIEQLVRDGRFQIECDPLTPEARTLTTLRVRLEDPVCDRSVLIDKFDFIWTIEYLYRKFNPRDPKKKTCMYRGKEIVHVFRKKAQHPEVSVKVYRKGRQESETKERFSTRLYEVQIKIPSLGEFKGNFSKLSPALKDKVNYAEDKRLLTFKGFMKKEEKEELLKLSEDPSYKEAVEKLFQVSRKPDTFIKGKERTDLEVNGPQKLSQALLWIDLGSWAGMFLVAGISSYMALQGEFMKFSFREAAFLAFWWSFGLDQGKDRFLQMFPAYQKVSERLPKSPLS